MSVSSCPRPENICLKYYDFWSNFEKRPGIVLFYYMISICITWRGWGSTYVVCYQTCVIVLSIVTNEYAILLLWKYGLKVCVVSFGFWSSFLKVYIYLCCINTHRQTTTPFYLWLQSSRVILICWYYTNTIKVCVILLGFYSTQYKVYIHQPWINKQQWKTSPFNITHNHIATAKLRDCIRVQPIIVRGTGNSGIICLLQPSQTIHYCNK